MPPIIPRFPACVTAAFAGAVLLAAATSTADPRAPASGPVAREGWSWRVVAENLVDVDNLVLDDAGVLYATLERSRPAGRVVRLERGVVATQIDGLDKPDGLLYRNGFLFVTEEKPGGRVLEYELATKKLRTLATLSKPEGIDMFPDGDLLVSEDVMDGRLLRVRRDGRPPQVLLTGLKRPEGLVIRPDGSIIFAETATGRVLSYRNGGLNVVLDDLAEPDQVELSADGALWVTEDAEDGRLLRFRDGVLETIVSGLRYPQGMAIGADGAVWLAEQGRRRILVVRRRDAGA